MSIQKHSLLLPYPTPLLCTAVCVRACTQQFRNSPSWYSELKCNNFSIASRNLPKPSKQQKVWPHLPFLWWKPSRKAMVYQDPAEWLMAQITKLDSKLTWRSGLLSRVPTTALPNRWLAPRLSQGTGTRNRVNGYFLAVFFLFLIVLSHPGVPKCDYSDS